MWGRAVASASQITTSRPCLQLVITPIPGSSCADRSCRGRQPTRQSQSPLLPNNHPIMRPASRRARANRSISSRAKQPISSRANQAVNRRLSLSRIRSAKAAEARVALLADDDVVRAPRCRDSWPPTRSAWSSRYRREAWGRLTGGVHEHDRGCRQLKRPFHHLAHIDRRVIDGAFLLHVVCDDLVALVEEQNAELLLGLEAHRGAAMVEHLAPRGEPLQHLAAQEPKRCRAHELDLGDGRLAEARHFAQALVGRAQRLGKGAEMSENRLGDRLGWPSGARNKISSSSS